MEDAGCCASGRASAFDACPSDGFSIDVSEKERALGNEEDCASGEGPGLGEVVQISDRARWLKTLSKCLPDRVAGQFIVKGLVANTLLDRPENPMLFHAGD